MTSNDQPTVLLVEDDQELVSLYHRFLEERYSVRTAVDGQEALDEIDESVDLVLLDRRMPRMSGDEFLRKLRDRGFDMPVTMVTAVDPETDIVDMEFDDYLVKPVTRDDLLEQIQAMLRRSSYDKIIRKHFSIASKLAVLQAEHSMDELERTDEYRRLSDRFATSKEEAKEQLDEMSEDEFDALFRDLGPSEASLDESSTED